MTDCCIIGGGIVGLSIARELAGRGLSVRVLAREGRHETASWAAAGIFPPAPDHAAATPIERLTSCSDRLHRRWAHELLEETGIDNGLRACGGLHVGREPRGRDRLRSEAEAWRAKGAACEWLDAAEVAAREPALAGAEARGTVGSGYVLPDESRILPPRHLDALQRSCEVRGVEVVAGVEIHGLEIRGGRIDRVIASGAEGRAAAAWYVLAAGAWSGGLAEHLGAALDTRPIRGQIVLVNLGHPVLGRIVNRGLDYLVPRPDGRLLVGSTIEDVGFDPAPYAQFTHDDGLPAAEINALSASGRTSFAATADGVFARSSDAWQRIHETSDALSFALAGDAVFAGTADGEVIRLP